MRDRYPGWEPRTCARCYQQDRQERGGADRSRPGGSSKDVRPTPATARPPGALLTLSQVLERYVEGPDDGVFTDGSASPNPGPGGWGAVYVRAGSIIDQAYGSDEFTTNNRMELTALLEGVRLVPPGTEATVFSDSNLAVRTVTEWAKGWERRGWRRKTGPVENLDLVRELYELIQTRPEITIRWIKAHSGNRWNEYADSLASAYRRDEL